MKGYGDIITNHSLNAFAGMDAQVEAKRLEASARGQGIAMTCPKLAGDFSALNAENMTTMTLESLIMPTSAVPAGEVYEFRTREALKEFMIAAGHWADGGVVTLEDLT